MAYNWPSGHKAGTTTTDAATDRIDLARADIQQNIVNVNEIIDMFDLASEPSNGQILKYNATNDRFEVGTDAGTTGFDGTANLVVSDGVSLLTPDSTAGITFQTSGSVFGAGVDYIQLGKVEAAGDIRPAGSTGELGTSSNRFNIFAGDINISGTQTGGNSTVGVHDIWVPVQAMYPTADGGCAPITTIEVTEGRPELRVLDFDKDTTEFAQFSIAMPKSWNEGTITFTAYWTAASGSGGCSWGLQGVSVSDDDAVAAAFGTAVVVDDTLIAANDLHISPTSSAVTIAGTPQEGDVSFFQIFRDHDDSNDTLSADARLIGIKIHYTTNAETDA